MQRFHKAVFVHVAIKYLTTIVLFTICFVPGDLKADAQSVKSRSDAPAFKDKIFLDPGISPATLGRFLKNKNIEGAEAASLRKFYAGRNFQFAWFTQDGLTEQTQSFWNKYEQYLNYSRDSSFYNAALHQTIDSLLSEDRYIRLATDTAIELLLTHQFYTFIQHAYIGKIDPQDFQWHIPPKKVAPLSLLNNLLSEPKNDSDWLPVSEQYEKMRDKFIGLQNRQQMEPIKPIVLEGRQLIKSGDSSSNVVNIKRRLFMSGDLPVLDTNIRYSSEAVSAVRKFQRRHGLKDDGIIGPNVIKALNVTLEARIKQLMINMERLRWMPERASGTSVWVNIPEFKLQVYEDREETLNMDIIVGQAAHRTVIFSDEIQHIVFSPYWNLPQSIVRREIVPAMNRDDQYLVKHQMEITGTRNGLPIIRQKPGKSNALGRVKFIFPNRYSIYLHDTPAKHLFERTRRAFSHGCIRLSAPSKLAKYLLKNDPSWTESAIRRAMLSNQEKWVRLDQKVPVYIGYFTAWVDEAGELNFRDDIYGHDKRMAAQLFND